MAGSEHPGLHSVPRYTAQLITGFVVYLFLVLFSQRNLSWYL